MELHGEGQMKAVVHIGETRFEQNSDERERGREGDGDYRLKGGEGSMEE